MKGRTRLSPAGRIPRNIPRYYPARPAFAPPEATFLLIHGVSFLYLSHPGYISGCVGSVGRWPWRVSMIHLLMVLTSLASPVRIAVLGDRTGGPDDSEFNASLKAVCALSPDVLVNVGDLVDGYTDDVEALQDQWDHVFGMIDPILGGLPFVMTPGNHDITYDAAEPVWLERTGSAPDRIEEVGGVVFVVWDTSRDEDLEAETLGRLDSLLALVEPSDTALLLTHRPFWMLWGIDSGSVESLRGMVAEADVEAVLGGHIHTYAWERVEGVEYITMGTSGGDYGEESADAGCLPQVGWLTLDGDSVSFALIDPRSVYPLDMNTTSEETLLYQISGNLAFPVPLTGSGRAVLNLDPVEDVERLVEISVDPGVWVITPDSVSVPLGPQGRMSLEFDVARIGVVFPAPVLHIRLPYGDRGKIAELDTCWPVARQASAGTCGAGASIDGIAAPGEYPEPPETVFASEDGGSAEGGPIEVLIGYRDGMLRFHSTMALEPGSLLEDESFGIVVYGDGACWRVKAFPDGGSSAIRYSNGEVSDWEGGWHTAASGSAEAWEAEVGVDLGAIGAQDHGEVRVHMYRFSTDASATWSWPLDFEESAMGTVEY